VRVDLSSVATSELPISMCRVGVASLCGKLVLWRVGRMPFTVIAFVKQLIFPCLRLVKLAAPKVCIVNSFGYFFCLIGIFDRLDAFPYGQPKVSVLQCISIFSFNFSVKNFPKYANTITNLQ